MDLDKQTANQLVRFAEVFREARERNANEADTVMYLVKFFEVVLGYDALRGEIAKEVQIGDRFCDLALKIDGDVKVLVEAKAAAQKTLVEKHIEQAENYAARAGNTWVVLTNGIEWRLYHLNFTEGEGIVHELVFQANLLDEVAKDAEALWTKLEILSRASVKKGALDAFWDRKKVLSPASVVRVLFHEEVLKLVRRVLHKDAEALLDIGDVFEAVRDVISKEALAEAGDLGIVKRKKKHKKVHRTDEATGHTVVEEVEVGDDEAEPEPAAANPAPEGAKIPTKVPTA